MKADARISDSVPLEHRMADHALAYAARGWHVFPAEFGPDNEKKSHKAAKHSNGRAWGATTNAAEIRRDFGRWPDAIGIVTGPKSGIFVVEADTPEGHDVDGIASLRALEAKHGPLPATLMAESPSGSLHYYFKWPDGVTIKNDTSKIASGVDQRGEGGMVIAPPSVRPGKGHYRWLNANAVADAPQWLIKLATAGDGDALHVANSEPEADPALLTAAMAVIPNDAVYADKPPGVTQQEYNKVGMACFAAFGGSAEGFAAFDQWARKSKKYHGGTKERWNNYKKYPPTSIGAGSIIRWANEAQPDWRRQFEDAQADAHIRASARLAGELILSPGTPMHSARKIVARKFTKDALRTLHRHRAAFWSWTGSYYELLDQETIRSKIWEVLEKAKRREKTKDEDGLEGFKIMPFRPKGALVNEVADAMRAVTQLDGHIETPTWLNDDTLPPASEFFACGNGLLHLPSGEMYPPTPKYFGLNASEVMYDPQAKEPTKWIAFLHELFGDDQQANELLQEWFGYSLAPDTSQQKILLMVGPKRSGKGTIARVLKKLLGSTSVAGPTMSSLGETFGLEPLITKSLAIISDARIGQKTNKEAIVERLLSISGEDQMTIARKFIAAWHGQLQTRFTILTNELPVLADGSGALASRFIVLLLTESFFGKEDRALTEKLLTELPGILKWAIEGYRRLRERGHFVVPDSAQKIIDSIETLGAPVKAFIQDREYVIDPRLHMTVQELWDDWVRWSAAEGRDKAGTKQWFGRNLKSALPRIFTQKFPKPKTGESQKKDEYELCYVGIDRRYPPWAS
jgi:putative DNA primase/helicase